MQSDRKTSPRQVVLPQKNHVSIYDLHSAASATATGGVFPVGLDLSRPSHGVEFQPSETCPRNFIIFDHTENSNQIMFHPEIAHELNPPVHFHGTPVGDNTDVKFGNNVDMGIPSPFSEDSDDINVLLSLDYYDKIQRESEEEEEEEEISTARTQHYDGSSSPDSCSNYAPKFRKLECPSSHRKSSCSGHISSEGKQKKMQKMVKVLQGMVPGGDQMNTAAVLDEAVRYLKSMKMEAQKLGIQNLEQFP